LGTIFFLRQKGRCFIFIYTEIRVLYCMYVLSRLAIQCNSLFIFSNVFAPPLSPVLVLWIDMDGILFFTAGNRIIFSGQLKQ